MRINGGFRVVLGVMKHPPKSALDSHSEGIAKFVWQPSRMHKPSLQDDIKLESMLNCLMLAILQQAMVIGNLHNTKKITKCMF